VSTEQPATPRYRLFGEELGGDPPLLQLLAEAQENLQALADRYGADLSQDEQFELLDEALDELDAALERVREARAKLARIELRLATSYETAVARIRQAEREA
jgi:LPS O-antigen subunit length determinant protein (WzzB/FepE family)